MLVAAIAAQQSREQFCVLCADPHGELAGHPVQVVRAERVLFRVPPIGVHLRCRFLAGLICRGASPPPMARRASPPFKVSAWIPWVIVHVRTSTARVSPQRVQARARPWTNYGLWTITVCDGVSAEASEGVWKRPRRSGLIWYGLDPGRPSTAIVARSGA